MSRAARQLEVLERIANALERIAAPSEPAMLETVDVEGAAKLLHTTPRVIYVRHQRGQLPKPLPGSRRLIWRKADLLRGK